MVFPGQGSQSVAMQSGLAESCEEVMSTYALASEQLGYDLWDLVQNGPVERLNETVVTQPAMLTAGMAAWHCWKSAGGVQPAQLAGHSLGEYTALVVAGALDFADALLLVKRRAELMQEAVPAGSGAMAAILGLDDDVVRSVCDHAAQGEVVSAVNFNSPGQVVIAGSTAAVERAAAGAKEAGARRALMLSVSVPSHCALMKPAAEQLATALAKIDFSVPEIPVINNVDATAYKDTDDIRDGLKRQLYSPVRWVDSVQQMIAGGASLLVECGPGKILTGLAKRIDRSLPAICIDSSDAIEKAMS
jgi:[acyl-carrier-protein] S-malonyltransferase